MTTQDNVTAAEAELRAAEAALEGFDASTLVNEDGSTNESAQNKVRALDARVDAAKTRLQTLRQGSPA